jgi:hypothetical protein
MAQTTLEDNIGRQQATLTAVSCLQAMSLQVEVQVQTVTEPSYSSAATEDMVQVQIQPLWGPMGLSHQMDSSIIY